jgi:hypothetical protein
MDLTPYLEALRRDLAATAEPGGAEVTRAAEMLIGSLEASVRLCLMEALSDATAEITSQLDGTTVDVRLRGREAELVVTEMVERPEPAPAPRPAPIPEGGDLARLTLRLPEPLKDELERAATAEGISVNAWLVRATAAALGGSRPAAAHQGTTSHQPGKRITGFAQA